MVSFADVQASSSRNIEIYAPHVAIFVRRRTAGIGKAASTALVSKQTPIKAYVIGRDKASR